MKEIARNLLELAMNEENYEQRENLENLVRDLLETLEMTINCPSDWRSIKEELSKEYAYDRDAQTIINW